MLYEIGLKPIGIFLVVSIHYNYVLNQVLNAPPPHTKSAINCHILVTSPTLNDNILYERSLMTNQTAKVLVYKFITFMLHTMI